LQIAFAFSRKSAFFFELLSPQPAAATANAATTAPAVRARLRIDRRS
jgi:hypothetical protein